MTKPGRTTGKERAQVQCRHVVSIVASLDFILSQGKRQLIPQQTARFLGFIVNAKAQAFRVPYDKVQAFASRLIELERQPVPVLTGC